MTSCELSILMPCLNEAATLGVCITRAQRFLTQHRVRAEILIVDNGSTDGSQAIATQMGARLITVAERGYGRALKGGLVNAQGHFIIMADADGSYDVERLAPFLQKLREGYDLVIGNRFRGGIQPGAMPFLNRYLGNPTLSGMAHALFDTPIGDICCGLRGVRKSAASQMGLQTAGMEFAVEVVVKAVSLKMRIAEVPITLFPAGRKRPPHLRPWRDGWRTSRFLLSYYKQVGAPREKKPLRMSWLA